MKEHPILFSGSMVRAILEGRKTQTRRVMKPSPKVSIMPLPLDLCPYGSPGDRLWVRETWQPINREEHFLGLIACLYRANCSNDMKTFTFISRFDGSHITIPVAKWKPPIHMPRWASHITLEIVSIRVERLQEISEKDAVAEGIFYHRHMEGYVSDEEGRNFYVSDPRRSFDKLWDSINAKKGFGWDANPWVWVIEFRRYKEDVC